MVLPFESPLEGMLFDCLAMTQRRTKAEKNVYIFIKQVQQGLEMHVFGGIEKLA